MAVDTRLEECSRGAEILSEAASIVDLRPGKPRIKVSRPIATDPRWGTHFNFLYLHLHRIIYGRYQFSFLFLPHPIIHSERNYASGSVGAASVELTTLPIVSIMDFFYFDEKDLPIIPIRVEFADGTPFFIYNGGCTLADNSPPPFLRATPWGSSVQGSLIRHLRQPEALDTSAPWMMCLCPDPIVGLWYHSEEPPRLILRGGKIELHSEDRALVMCDIRLVEKLMKIIQNNTHMLGQNGAFVQPFKSGALLQQFKNKEDADFAYSFAKYHVQVSWAYIKWCSYNLHDFESAIGGLDNYNIAQDTGIFNFRNRGVILDLERDWPCANFPCYARNKIPFYILSSPALFRDPRFTRLNPDVIEGFIAMRRKVGPEVKLADVVEDEKVSRQYDTQLQQRTYIPFNEDRARRAASLSWMHQNQGWEIDYYLVDYERWVPRPVTEEHSKICFRIYDFVVAFENDRKIKRVTFLSNRPL